MSCVCNKRGKPNYFLPEHPKKRLYKLKFNTVRAIYTVFNFA